MEKKLILIGSGGHAKSILESLSMSEKNDLIGYIDLIPSSYMNSKNIKYLGDDDQMSMYKDIDNLFLILGLSYIGNIPSFELREKIISKYKKYNFLQFISNNSYVSKESIIGNGTIVLNNVYINASCKIGEHCLINNNVLIEHDCTIGNNVQIAPGAIILGGVTIADNCFIGAGVVIRDSVDIVSNTIIGMGCIVTKNITDSGTYYGNPLKKY